MMAMDVFVLHNVHISKHTHIHTHIYTQNLIILIDMTIFWHNSLVVVVANKKRSAIGIVTFELIDIENILSISVLCQN